MTKTILITVLLAFSLAACSPETTTTEEAPIPIPATETAVELVPMTAPTEDPAVQAGQPATQEPVQETEPTAMEEPARVQTFAIVPGESSVTYEVGEVFIRDGNVFSLALGVTDVISGEIQIDYNNPQNSTIGPISVDISKFTSDQNLRDKAIREEWLESNTYPIATFVPTNIEGIPEAGEEGVEYALRITGDMTLREITKEVTFDATVKVENEMLSGTATTTLLMSDFGAGPIDIIGILKTEDEVKLTFNFVAQPVSALQ